MIRSAVRRVLVAGLLLFALLIACSCAPFGAPDGSSPPPSAEVLRARIAASAGKSYPSVHEWLSAWGFPAYNASVLAYTELVYGHYYVGEMPDVDTVARTLGSMFVENMHLIDASDPDEVTDLIMECYLLSVGDVYAYYMNPEAYADRTSGLEGSFVGIGVHVIYREGEDGFCRIVGVFSDSPAAEAGVEIGDCIVAVDGVRYPERSYEELIGHVRGEAGSTVSLTLSRGGEEYTVSIVRRAVVEETAVGWLLPEAPSVGYIRISEFDLTTFDQFKATYERLIREGATEMIFDVRDNPGGLLVAILDVLDYLVPDGVTLARYEYYDGTVESSVSTDGHEIPSDLPIAVLTNQRTVSAGELFASALGDFAEMGYLDVTLVGEATFGKGMMQGTITLPGGRATTVSYAYYNPPISDNYEGVGVIPDVLVELPEPLFGLGSVYLLSFEEDVQLQRALSILSDKSDGGVSLP